MDNRDGDETVTGDVAGVVTDETKPVTWTLRLPRDVWVALELEAERRGRQVGVKVSRNGCAVALLREVLLPQEPTPERRVAPVSAPMPPAPAPLVSVATAPAMPRPATTVEPADLPPMDTQALALSEANLRKRIGKLADQRVPIFVRLSEYFGKHGEPLDPKLIQQWCRGKKPARSWAKSSMQHRLMLAARGLEEYERGVT